MFRRFSRWTPENSLAETTQTGSDQDARQQLFGPDSCVKLTVRRFYSFYLKLQLFTAVSALLSASTGIVGRSIDLLHYRSVDGYCFQRILRQYCTITLLLLLHVHM